MSGQRPVKTYHLPEPEIAAGSEFSRLGVGKTELSFPAPDPAWLERLAEYLGKQHAASAARPIGEVVALLDRVNARWSDSSSPERREADCLLAAATGYPPAVLSPALDHLFAGLRAPHLSAMLAEELGDAAALDTWIERPALGTRSRALGPRLTLVIASGNVPMAAIPAIVSALLLKSPVLVKPSSDEPVLAGLYLQSLAAADADLARSCAAVWWPGGDEAILKAVLRPVEAVIAFGGDSTLQSLASRLPVHVRFQPHGHRVGFAVVGREPLTSVGLQALAEAAARDVAEFDQQGCVAPHYLFAERGGEVEPRALAAAVAEALAARSQEWPRASLSPAASAAIHQLRGAAQIRAAIDAEAALFASSRGTDWTVVLDPSAEFGPGCLYRTLVVVPVDDLADVPARVGELGPYLQTVTAAVDEPRLAELAVHLAHVGVTRICPLGRAQRPASGWRTDGRPRLAELVRWIDWELS